MFLFDESMRALVTRSKGIGFDIEACVAQGTVDVQSIDPAELSPGEFIQRIRTAVEVDGAKMIVLDMNSSESPTYGEQECSAYNGHFGRTCYHPLFVFNQFGDVERCALRPGNVHSAADWRDVLEPVVARYRGVVKRRYFRGDAAFANPEIYEFLAGIVTPYLVRRSPDRTLEQVSDLALQDGVGRQPDRIAVALGL